MRKVILLPIILMVVLASGVTAGVLIADTTDITLVGEDILEIVTLETPGKRIDKVYRLGDDKVVLVYEDTGLIPVGSGDSMAPMVAEGHLVLIAKDYEEIKVGDFIVAENWAGRFFHQVVEVRDGEKGKVYMTRGINNAEGDKFPVFEDDVVGVAIAVIW